MKLPINFLVRALMLLALAGTVQAQSTVDTFGSGTNAFTINFTAIGDAGNANDSTGYGGVSYDYRMGTFEISQDQVEAAISQGLGNVSAGPWRGNHPATALTWYEAALFINWLNTSTGHQAAYNFSGTTMSLWSSAEAWQEGGENLFRNKDAYYFLPSEDEWYKAAYYDGDASLYYDYPTGSDSAPTPVLGGTAPDTAVFGIDDGGEPALVNDAGGTSSYQTMGQGGNVWEMLESAVLPPNGNPSQERAFRGGDYRDPEGSMSSETRFSMNPDFISSGIGFRVASVPEPSAAALTLVSCLVWFLGRPRRQANGD